MKPEKKVIYGYMTDLERMRQSVSGNPRYRCVIGGLIFRTSPDSSIGYEMTNYLGKYVRCEVTPTTITKIEEHEYVSNV